MPALHSLNKNMIIRNKEYIFVMQNFNRYLLHYSGAWLSLVKVLTANKKHKNFKAATAFRYIWTVVLALQ